MHDFPFKPLLNAPHSHNFKLAPEKEGFGDELPFDRGRPGHAGLLQAGSQLLQRPVAAQVALRVRVETLLDADVHPGLAPQVLGRLGQTRSFSAQRAALHVGGQAGGDSERGVGSCGRHARSGGGGGGGGSARDGELRVRGGRGATEAWCRVAVRQCQC